MWRTSGLCYHKGWQGYWIVKWGDYGKRIKDIRAVIAKFPLNDLVENKNYDISSCPYGFEE